MLAVSSHMVLGLTVVTASCVVGFTIPDMVACAGFRMPRRDCHTLLTTRGTNIRLMPKLVAASDRSNASARILLALV